MSPRTSPSGEFALDLVLEEEERGGRTWEYRRLHIYDRAGELIYVSPERFPAWFGLEATWDEQDRAWVASADTGMVVFCPGPDGWRRAVWDPNSPAPTMFDAGTGEELPVIAEPPPEGLEGVLR